MTDRTGKGEGRRLPKFPAEVGGNFAKFKIVLDNSAHVEPDLKGINSFATPRAMLHDSTAAG
jgi:hypothetical protein